MMMYDIVRPYYRKTGKQFEWKHKRIVPWYADTTDCCLTKYTLVVHTLSGNCRLKSLGGRGRWFWKIECVGEHSNEDEGEKGIWSIVHKGSTGIERWKGIRKMAWLRLFQCPLDFVNDHLSLFHSISPLLNMPLCNSCVELESRR